MPSQTSPFLPQAHIVTFACMITEDAENRLEGVKEEEAEENEDEEGKEEMATLKPDVTFEAKSSTDFSQSEGSTSHNPSISFYSPLPI